MDMEEALRARLLAATGVAGTARVAWFELPRAGGLPAILLDYAGADRGWTHEGPTGFDMARIQFGSWAVTSAEARSLGNAVQAEMERAPWLDFGGIRFSPGFLETKLRDTDALADGTTIYRDLRDFRFHFKPTPA